MAEMPKSRPHAVAIQVGCTEKVPEAERFEYNVWTVQCDGSECDVKFQIFVDIPHYTSGEQFGKYIETLLTEDHKNKRKHPAYILLPMEAEFTS